MKYKRELEARRDKQYYILISRDVYHSPQSSTSSYQLITYCSLLSLILAALRSKMNVIVSSDTSELTNLPDSSPVRPQTLRSSPPSPSVPSATLPQRQVKAPLPAPSTTDLYDDEGKSESDFEERPGCRIRRPRHYKTTAAKLQYLRSMFRTWRMPLGTFCSHIADRRTLPSFREHWTSLKNWWMSPAGMQSLLSTSERQKILDTSDSWEIIIDLLRKELDEVSKLPVFGHFDVKNYAGKLEVLPALVDDIQRTAPRLSRLLMGIDDPTRESDSQRTSLSERHLFLLSNLCMSLHHKTCNYLPTTFGLYLLDGGAAKRVIETFSQLGVCPSHTTLVTRRNEIANYAKEQVRNLGERERDIVISWDNFEYQDSKAEERITNSTKFMSITTAVACIGLKYPPLGLKQPMLHPQLNFSASDFIRKVEPQGQIDLNIQQQVNPNVLIYQRITNLY